MGPASLVERLKRIDRRKLEGLFRGAKVELATFWHNYTVTGFLIAVFVTFLLLLPAAYFIRLVLWSASLLIFVLSFIGSVLSAVISWLMVKTVTLSRFLLPLTYPATVVALAGAWVGKWFKFDDQQLFEWLGIRPSWAQFLTKLTLSFAAGQLILKLLPPLFSLITKQVETAPLVLITLLVIVFIVVTLSYHGVIRGWNINNQPPVPAAPVVAADEDTNICCICYVNPRNVLIQPCRHFGVCRDCIDLLEECPSCRGPIESHQEIFPQ